MRRVFALSVLVLVSLSACSGNTHKATSPTTADGPNPDVIPAVITPAYVDAVFKVLNHIDGDASRTLYLSNAVTAGVLADLRAIYADPLYASEVQIAHQTLASDRRNVRDPPGDIRTSVVRIISASATCVFVQTKADYSAVLYRPGPSPASTYWVLSTKRQLDDPYHLNPTPWSLGFNAVYLTAQTIPNQCAGN